MGTGPLVQLAATPWLSRLYTPAEFGSFALFTSAVSILATIACLRYEAAVQVVENDLVKLVTMVALCCALSMFLLFGAIVLSGAPQYFYRPFAELGRQIWGIPVAAACGGVMYLVYYLTLRQDKFVLNALVRSLQPIFFVIMAIGFTRGGLIQAQIISWVAVTCIGLACLAGNIAVVPWQVLWATARSYRQYPSLLTFTTLLDAAAVALPVFIISAAYGAVATGNFSQLQRLIGSPLLLASAVMGQMFFKYSGVLFRAGKSSGPLLWRTIKILSGTAVLLLLVLTAVGEPACKLLLGRGWRVDTLFVLLVTVPLVFRTVVSPVSAVFLTHHRVTTGVRWQIAYFVTTSIVLSLSAKVFSFEYFLLVYAVHEMVQYAVYLAMANRVVSEYSA